MGTINFKHSKSSDQKWLAEQIGRLEDYFSCSRPFLPDYLFYSASGTRLGATGTGGVISTGQAPSRSASTVFLTDAMLNSMANQLFDWLHIARGNSVVEFSSSISSPGVFIKQGANEIIRINSKHSNDPYAVGAILAHEMMHLFLGRIDIFNATTEENELLTDLATIQTGLGVLIVNGMRHNSNWMLTIAALFAGGIYYKEERNYFGYFKGESYGRYFLKWLKSKSIPLEEVKGYIHPRALHFLPGSILVGISNEDLYISELRKDRNVETVVKFAIAGVLILLAILRFA
jgi:hypothetical protein